MFVVEIHGPEDERRHVRIDGAEATLGRLPDNDLTLPRGNVSKRHARIVQRHAKIIVIDLRSTNGTYLNGRKLTAPRILQRDDVLSIGDYRVVVHAPASDDNGADAGDPALAGADERAAADDDEVTNERLPPAFRARDQVEHQLLAEISAGDEAAGVVYADWLEARGELDRAEFLRVQHDILACGADRPRRNERSARLLALMSSLDLSWRSQVARAAIEHCPNAVELGCPKEWGKLKLTPRDGVRSCGSCRRNVHYVTTAAEGHLHVDHGDRVAIGVGGLRWGRAHDAFDDRFVCSRCQLDVAAGPLRCPRCRGPLRHQEARRLTTER